MKRLKGLAIAIVIAGLTLPAAGQIDTSGITGWPQMYNSMASWEEGALMANAKDFPDFGWGLYNMITHSMVGDSIFVVKMTNPDGSTWGYKALWIVGKDPESVYTFRHVNLDGSDEKEVVIDMKDYTISKQFIYYNLRGDSLVDEQPHVADWDLMLTKFSHTGLGGYPVTGFLSSDSVTISVFHAVDSATAADATLADTTEFTDSISAIGDSWSKLEGFSILPLDTIAYFIKVPGGEIYQMQATFFESGFSGLGRVGIRKKHSDSSNWIHDTLVMGSFYADEVYYSVKNGSVGHVSRTSWDIGFKSNRISNSLKPLFTSSITANTTMGVEVYTYPKGDTSAWYSTTSTGPTIKAGTGLSLYPVPATDDLFISYELKSSQPVNISVIDVTGKQVLYREAELLDESELRLDISSLSPGIYILQLRNKEVAASGRFTKRR
jgi:hypothetical protein